MFKRILLKISGEALKGESGSLDAGNISAVAALIKESVDAGVETAVICGAGNLFRGLSGCREGMDRNCADNIGMLATCMNALALRDAVEALGGKAEILSALAINGVLKPYDYREADRLLKAGYVVFFAAGTGHPFFTTDTTSALRACEIHADAVFKATKVDGVYSDDPVKNPAAVRYEHLSFSKALADQLKVMDATAFALCQANNLPIVVFRFGEPGTLTAVVNGDFSKGTLVDNN